MTNAPKTVLAIHDLPGLGRAALSVIVPVLSALGVQAVALPAAVLSTHTGGLGAPAKLANPAYGPAALAHYHRLGIKFDCIYSGYLADAAQAKLVQQAFALWPRAFKVVDPVLGDGGRLYSGLGADMVPAMYDLCSHADLIVPNVTEAALLLGDPLPGAGVPPFQPIPGSLQALGCGVLCLVALADLFKCHHGAGSFQSSAQPWQ